MKILELVKNIQNKTDDNFFEKNKTQILDEISEIIKTDNHAPLLNAISEQNFYYVLSHLQYNLLKEAAAPFLAKLWYKKLISTSDKDKCAFLNSFLDDSVDIFSILMFFKEFMAEKIEVDSAFLAGWFINLAKFVEDDLAAFKFYDGIEPFCKANSKIAYEVLNILLNLDYSQNIHNLVLNILGTLRAIGFDKIDELDLQLKDSNNINMKKYYYSSFCSYFAQKEPDKKVLEDIFSQILNHNNIEIKNQAYFLAYREFLSSKKEDIKEFIIKWMVENSKNISDLSKYYCSCLLLHAVDEEKFIDDTCKTLFNIQPFNDRRIYSTFLILLKNYPDKFNPLLLNILKINSLDGLILDEYFNQEIAQNIDKKFFTELFISKNLNIRNFAQEIYINHFKILTLNQDLLLTIDDKLLELIFKEILLKIHNGDIFAKLILDLNNRIDKIENIELKSIFETEISYQSINHPIECFEVLKEAGGACELIKNCLRKIDIHFNLLNEFKDSPVNSFAFPGFYEAVEKSVIKWQKEIMEGAKEKSVFMSLIHSVELLYADKHAHRIDDGICKEEPFQEIKTSTELPKLSFIDPIYEFLKAHLLKKDVSILRKEIDNAQ